MNKNTFFFRKSFYNFLKILLDSLIDFVYPPTCLICENRLEEQKFICEKCWKEIQSTRGPFVKTFPEKYFNIRETLFFDEVITCFNYNPKIEILVHLLKYQRGKRLGFLLGQIMGEAVSDIFKTTDNILMIPVPLHRVRQRERGYNQSEILCRGLSSRISVPVCLNILVRHKNTVSQTKLSAQERQTNVKDAFSLRRPDIIQKKQIILVDDVITTGATMNSCTRNLKEAGAEKVVGMALAHA